MIDMRPTTYHDEYLAAIDAWYDECMIHGFSIDNPRPNREDYI